MDFSLEALQVAVLILPGFLSVQLRDAFTPARVRSDFERFMEALAFSIASLAVVFSAAWLGGQAGELEITVVLVEAVMAAVLLGLVAGIAAGKDWPYRLSGSKTTTVSYRSRGREF